VEVHSLTLSYTPRNMKCDSQASLWACTFASPCLGCEPKVKVVTVVIETHKTILKPKFKMPLCFPQFKLKGPF